MFLHVEITSGSFVLAKHWAKLAIVFKLILEKNLEVKTFLKMWFKQFQISSFVKSWIAKILLSSFVILAVSVIMQKTFRTNKHARTWDRMNEDDNLIDLETKAAYDISRGGGISQLMLAKRAEFPPPDFFTWNLVNFMSKSWNSWGIEGGKCVSKFFF